MLNDREGFDLPDKGIIYCERISPRPKTWAKYATTSCGLGAMKVDACLRRDGAVICKFLQI